MNGYWPITVQLSRQSLEGEEGESGALNRTGHAMRCCVEEASDI